MVIIRQRQGIYASAACIVDTFCLILGLKLFVFSLLKRRQRSRQRQSRVQSRRQQQSQQRRIASRSFWFVCSWVFVLNSLVLSFLSNYWERTGWKQRTKEDAAVFVAICKSFVLIWGMVDHKNKLIFLIKKIYQSLVRLQTTKKTLSLWKQNCTPFSTKLSIFLWLIVPSYLNQIH